MRELRTLLVVAAVMVIGAVASASATAAEPALYECAKAAKNAEKHYTGGYNNSTCSEVNPKHEGKFELQEWNLAAKKGKAKAFKGKGKGANLEIVTVGGLSCASSADTGKFTGPKAAGSIVVTFKGCELNHKQCETGATLGEIVTKPLKGEIGYIEGGKAKHEVGVALTAETGLYEAEIRCGELEVRVHGTVIGLVTSKENVFTKEATLLFQQSGGKQHFTKLEGGPTDMLFSEIAVSGGEYGSALESGEATESKATGETLELKA